MCKNVGICNMDLFIKVSKAGLFKKLQQTQSFHYLKHPKVVGYACLHYAYL